MFQGTCLLQLLDFNLHFFFFPFTPIWILANEDLFALNLTDGISPALSTAVEGNHSLSTDLLLESGRKNVKKKGKPCRYQGDKLN